MINHTLLAYIYINKYPEFQLNNSQGAAATTFCFWVVSGDCAVRVFFGVLGDLRPLVLCGRVTVPVLG